MKRFLACAALPLALLTACGGGSSSKASVKTSVNAPPSSLDSGASSEAQAVVLGDQVKSNISGSYFATLSSGQLISEAKAICADLDSGTDPMDELRTKSNQFNEHGATLTQTAKFMGAAVGVYCNKHMAAIQKEANG